MGLVATLLPDDRCDCQVAAALTSWATTSDNGVGPLIADRPESENSIQPSLKPSSMRMRGVGFFIPCARKRVSQLVRGTISTRTGLPSAEAKAWAKSLGETRTG